MEDGGTFDTIIWGLGLFISGVILTMMCMPNRK
jgi:hypothetical protein